jgi:membrane protease subunit HflK
MAWNQPGGGNKDPWKGKDPGNEVEAFINRLKGMFGGGAGGGGRSGGNPPQGSFNPLPWLLAAFGIWLVFNSFKLINERERAVVLRFGEYNRIMEPGPNFKLPWPIESVAIVEATQIEPVTDKMMVLTRDENLVQVQYNVQYQITDPEAFLFGTREPRVLLQQATESAVREVIGNAPLETALYNRAGLVTVAQKALQEALEKYHTGLTITQLSLPDARMPDEVKEAFDDVIRAEQDGIRVQEEARAVASKVVPEARGRAASILAEAEGYREATIARAEGDAQRFTLLANQYRLAPQVTRKRLFLETMQEVLANNPKVIAADNGNILYLPVGAARGERTAAPAEAPIVRLPSTQAEPAPADAGDGRTPRGERNPGGR